MMGVFYRTLPSTDVVICSGGTITWTNMPAALTELLSNVSRRRTRDLRNMRQFRLHVGVATAGSAASKLGVQFSDDGGTTWYGLDNGTATTQSTVTQLIDATGSYVSAIGTVHANAQINNCLLRIAGDTGDAAADPQFSEAHIEFFLA